MSKVPIDEIITRTIHPGETGRPIRGSALTGQPRVAAAMNEAATPSVASIDSEDFGCPSHRIRVQAPAG